MTTGEIIASIVLGMSSAGTLIGIGKILGKQTTLETELKEVKGDVKEVKATQAKHETAIAVIAATAPRHSYERTIPGMPALIRVGTGTDGQ